MKKWRQGLIRQAAPLIDAIRLIDESALQIALVVDEQEHLVGTITDGDIRRTLLEQLPLDTPVSRVMCSTPMTARETDNNASVLAMMHSHDILHIPLVDDAGRLVGLRSLKELTSVPEQDNMVVLMAGGLGTRLRPLTENCPKPMLNIGGKPILETILENFIAHGFRRFTMCVNYMADIIKNHFGDGSRWNSHIQYVHESQRMGTAGALSLLPETPETPFFVMNGDLLTKTNFKQLIDFHTQKNSLATMCVREYELQIPFGVVHTDGERLTAIDEKPMHNFFVNAGIYVLNPDVLAMIPKGGFFDMPDLFKMLIADNRMTACFPLREYWLDIGRLDDFQRAEAEYVSNFCMTLKS
ncbi:nucleotidyltransferase family protein [Desulfovibrio psychrotolerans]|uniref:Alcohol dehydrogenase n=1 Tax=Desulfovibrio psychrotolerans TaxID=415242 RepID=A0A7J0BWM0_9BACT|nr:nucleotidyltransferase family protein [Desulfovibrio psychrotolerans]GFM38107.1 alcohol dehydrogenase [Desulfovibrio psychrotolerans]